MDNHAIIELTVPHNLELDTFLHVRARLLPIYYLCGHAGVQ